MVLLEGGSRKVGGKGRDISSAHAEPPRPEPVTREVGQGVGCGSESKSELQWEAVKQKRLHVQRSCCLEDVPFRSCLNGCEGYQ